jgi:restriction endonuclease S subunit
MGKIPISTTSSWVSRRFPDCVEKVAGTTKIPRKQFLKAGRFPIVSQEDSFINGYWDDEGDVLGLDHPIVVFGDHTRVLKYIDFDFVLGADGVKILKPRGFFHPKCFYYCLMANPLKHQGYARHYRQLSAITLSFPESLPEQERIVAILDEAFEGIATATAHAERNLHNARELFQSVLQSTFEQKGEDWVETTLGEVGKVSMCKRILKEQTSTNGDIPFYKIGTFGKIPNAFISSQIYEDYRARFSFPRKGDILISASGTIGRRVVYDGKPAYFQDSNIVWIANDETIVTNAYLYVFYGACDWNPSKGATIARLYNDDLRRIRIPFPKSKQTQKAIVQKLAALAAETRRLEAVYQRKLAVLAELKQSLLQRAFAGEL